MKYKEMFKTVKELEFDKKFIISTVKNTELSILRPSKVSKRFKNYDINKNFQIFLKIKDRSFRPNHLRILIDLNLRVRSRPDLKKELCIIFDNIFYKKDPDKEIKIIENEEFEHYLNDIKIIANLSQLFIIEQEYCYNKESNYEPASLFYQGWIRQFIDNIKEIDKLCMSVARYRPPGVKYTKKENKKHKEYDKNVKHQWYLNNYL